MEKGELEPIIFAHRHFAHGKEHVNAVKEHYSVTTGSSLSMEIRPTQIVTDSIANALLVAILEEKSEQLGSRDIF